MSDEELAKQLIEYVTEEKVSFLEDLASKFNLKTQDVISKIHQLEQEGRLTGVIDDRGKFIFLTPQELQNVANFINLRGILRFFGLDLDPSSQILALFSHFHLKQLRLYSIINLYRLFIVIL